MKSAEGVIEAVSIRKNGYGVKIGDDWFGGLGNDRPLKGMRVSIDVEDKQVDGKTFHNIVSWKQLKGENEKVYENNEDKIIRQSCLKAASNVVAASKISSINEAQILTIDIAEGFVNYVKNGKGNL